MDILDTRKTEVRIPSTWTIPTTGEVARFALGEMLASEATVAEQVAKQMAETCDTWASGAAGAYASILTRILGSWTSPADLAAKVAALP